MHKDVHGIAGACLDIEGELTLQGTAELLAADTSERIDKCPMQPTEVRCFNASADDLARVDIEYRAVTAWRCARD